MLRLKLHMFNIIFIFIFLFELIPTAKRFVRHSDVILKYNKMDSDFIVCFEVSIRFFNK